MVETVDEREPTYAAPLLLTKLHPPARRKQTVSRDRLMERLRPSLGNKLTLVAAPAGCGKTTLLGSWRDVEVLERPVAWLSLDRGDNDPVVLWTYVLAALRSVCPEIDVTSSPEQLGSARIVDHFLPELINSLATLGDVTLIVDDFHRLSAGPARESVAWFIEHAPSTFRLVLATRSEPALSLAALRAHGELVELRAHDLGFTRAEAELFLNERLELGLEDELVSGLVERTEGWPAGLYLAALSLQGADDRHALVSRFGAENRHVVDFLMDEVLEGNDPETQTLMLRSSIFERLCGPLCDTLLEQEGSAEMLRALSRSNLFLMPLDDRDEWYRFHHLFARLLRVELERREPGITPLLHRRAAAWYRERGSVHDVIWHLLEAEDFDDAAELLAAHWVQYRASGRFETLLALLDRLSVDLVRERSHLLFIKAWTLALCARHEEATETIAAAERGDLGTGPLPDGFSSLEAAVAMFHAGPGRLTDVGRGLANARRAAELIDSGSRWWPLLLWFTGHCLFLNGEYEEADRYLVECAGLAPTTAPWGTTAMALALRSLIAAELGRLDDQVRLADEAFALAEKEGTETRDIEVFTALGWSLVQQGKVDEGLPLLERGSALWRDWNNPFPQANALLYHASALRMLGDRDTLASTLAELRAIINRFTDPGILLDRLTALERPRRATRGQKAELSGRELVILRALTGTLSERDIGRELYLSHSTIHSHTKSIYRKLQVSSRAEAIKHGRELGLI